MTPKPHPQADEAARYVLDQLPANARHAFELQLTQSAELRALVQELEEGVEAMARAVPQRPPPPQTWNPIEQAIAREVERKIVRPPFWSAWWQSGWAAAAACAVAFIGYAWWPKASPVPQVKPGTTEVVTLVQSAPHDVVSSKPANVRSEPTFPTNILTVAELKPATIGTSPELASLRWQIASMQAQLEQLADVVAQQKAVLAEPGRFKFFPLASAGGEAGATPTAPLSPGLQRAMFYAMARDMGWLPGLAARQNPNGGAGATATTFAGIDFVDMNSTATTAAANPGVAASATTSSAASDGGSASEAAPLSIASTGGVGIPGMFSKDGLILTLDKTIVPRGSPVTFWSADGQVIIGSTVVNDNPTVVKIPINQIGDGMTVSLSTFAGNSNIGNFHIVRPGNAGGFLAPP